MFRLPLPGNQLSFMLRELVFLRCDSQFASYPFGSYSDSYKIVEPYVAATVWIHSDEIFFSIVHTRMKTFIKNQCTSTNSDSP